MMLVTLMIPLSPSQDAYFGPCRHIKVVALTERRYGSPPWGLYNTTKQTPNAVTAPHCEDYTEQQSDP